MRVPGHLGAGRGRTTRPIETQNFMSASGVKVSGGLPLLPPRVHCSSKLCLSAAHHFLPHYQTLTFTLTLLLQPLCASLGVNKSPFSSKEPGGGRTRPTGPTGKHGTRSWASCVLTWLMSRSQCGFFFFV